MEAVEVVGQGVRVGGVGWAAEERGWGGGGGGGGDVGSVGDGGYGG